MIQDRDDSKAREVRLNPKMRKVLEARCRAPSTAQSQAKRAWIVLPAAEGRSTRSIAEDYKRHGTTTLFAALEVSTGQIIAAHSKRRRRVEFSPLHESCRCRLPGPRAPRNSRNLNTHKKCERWLKKHSKVHVAFDVPETHGVDLRPLPLAERKSARRRWRGSANAPRTGSLSPTAWSGEGRALYRGP